MQGLSPHWLIEIIKAQQQEIQARLKKTIKEPEIEMQLPNLESRHDSNQCNNEKSQHKYAAFPIRVLKKTNSEPSHRLCRKANDDKNKLPSIQSMDDVRQVAIYFMNI